MKSAGWGKALSTLPFLGGLFVDRNRRILAHMDPVALAALTVTLAIVGGVLLLYWIGCVCVLLLGGNIYRLHRI